MFHKLLLITICLFACTLSACGEVTIEGKKGSGPTDGDGVAKLTWTKPTENTDESELTDLEGFYIYFGNEEDYKADTTGFKPYIKYVDKNGSSTDGNLNCQNLESNTKIACTITGLPDNTNWYFSVTAVNVLNIESQRSNIGCKKFNSSNCLI